MYLQCDKRMTTFTMTTNPIISIIFVNFQSVWSLSLALKSLFSREPLEGSFEVIVFNNDPRERVVLKQLSSVLPFRLVQSKENIGFGQGVNRAASHAQGDILGFLNPDTKWSRGSLTEIRGFFKEQSKETILGLHLVDELGAPEPWSKGSAPTLTLLLKEKVVALFGRYGGKKNGALDWVSGGGVFLSKKLFLDLGGFDKDFFLYFEDVDLCVRAKKRGGVIACHSGFSLEHAGGGSFRSPIFQKAQYYLSQERYFQKHRPKVEFWAVCLFHRIFKNI